MNARAFSLVAIVAGRGLLVGAGLLAGITSAFAGDDSVRLQVVPLAATANYSVLGDASPPRLDSFVGYTITVKNVGQKLSDNLVFRGRTLVRDREEKATFASYDTFPIDPQCRATNLNRTAIACRIGRLAPGASFGPFVVSFKTPVKNVNGIFDGDGQDFVRFRGTLIEAEDRDDFVDRELRNRVTLVTSNSTAVTSVCPSTGCTVFTGNGGQPTAETPRATQVIVPPGQTSTTIEIRELVPFDLPPESCSFAICYLTQITAIGNTGTEGPPIFGPPYLTIILRQDPSLYGEGSPTFGTLVYLADGQVGLGTLVGQCVNDSFPLDAEGNPRCLPSTFEGEPNPRILLSGVRQWRAISLSNGGWGIR